VIPQYVEIGLPVEYLEEQIFATNALYQSRMEIRAKRNISPITIINAIMNVTTNVNVL
jgi:hypothetical protein